MVYLTANVEALQLVPTAYAFVNSTKSTATIFQAGIHAQSSQRYLVNVQSAFTSSRPKRQTESTSRLTNPWWLNLSPAVTPHFPFSLHASRSSAHETRRQKESTHKLYLVLRPHLWHVHTLHRSTQSTKDFGLSYVLRTSTFPRCLCQSQ